MENAVVPQEHEAGQRLAPAKSHVSQTQAGFLVQPEDFDYGIVQAAAVVRVLFVKDTLFSGEHFPPETGQVADFFEAVTQTADQRDHLKLLFDRVEWKKRFRAIVVGEVFWSGCAHTGCVHGNDFG